MQLKRIIFVISILFFNSGLVFAEEALPSLDPIEKLFREVYDAWNAHDVEKLFGYYSKDFVTGDGISRDEYKGLTQKLWDTYPTIKLENQKRTIRSQDQYATISGIDFFYGDSKDVNKELEEKGTLNAISQGQVFLRKQGKEWKIVSDQINFELVTVFYGNAKKYLDEQQIFFSSPEQVRSGEQYSGTLYFVLPENVKATATINQELIQKPDPDLLPEESFQLISEHKLERLFAANKSNHNELLSATIILSKGIIEPKLDGLLYISKRVNVIPSISKASPDAIITYAFGEDPEQNKAKENKENKPEDDDDFGSDL